MSTARRKRLERLEQTNQTRRGPTFGALVLPPIEPDHDAWEREAMASQAALVEATRAGLDRPAQVTTLGGA